MNVTDCVNRVEIKDITVPLLKWFDANKRSLPWREEPTPYRVWVSEIMLQQTRVEAVKPYFERFMKELPDIASLAEAEEETLLKLWEGLGYYNRVRNLQKAAREILSKHDGSMPGDYEALLGLSGIGYYTAGAIASIAFGIKKPAVDGNVLRVLARLRADERSVSDTKIRQELEREMEDGMPEDRPGDFNQAMMELGAIICLPNGRPNCEKCPLQQRCAAHANGTELEYPKKDSKKPRTIEERTVLIIRHQGRIALHKRPPKGLLAGLYELPSVPGYWEKEAIVSFLSEAGIHAWNVTPLEESKHIFTHREWHMKCFLVEADALTEGSMGRDWIFAAPEETAGQYPIPSAFSAYRKYLGMKQTREQLS